MNFKDFLNKILSESGKATEKWGTSRANKSDIEAALNAVSRATKIDINELKSNLLGTTTLTLLGYKDDSGDIDIAIELTSSELMDDLHEKMMSAFNDEGILNKGIKVGSYAVPVSKNKKVPVDLMYVSSVDWAKFHFHSSEGKNSKYKASIRGQLLMAVTRYELKPNEDLIVLDDNENVIARASRAYKPIQGIERVFKIAPFNKKGTARLKSLVDISPEELRAELVKLDPKYKDVKFSDKPDLINDPNKAAEHLFGKGTKASDLDTVEEIIKLIQKKYSKNIQDKIFKDVAKEFSKEDIDLPPEIAQFR